MVGKRPAQHDARAGPVIEISVNGVNLKKMDILSASDPFVVLYATIAGLPSTPKVRVPAAPQPAEFAYVGETEVVWDNLDPRFTRRFILPEDRGISLIFEVYDADDTDMSLPLHKHDFIGVLETTVLDLASESVSCHTLCTKSFQKKSKLGSLSLTVEKFVLPPLEHPARVLSVSVTFEDGLHLPDGEAFFYVLVRAWKDDGAAKDDGSSKADGALKRRNIAIYRSGALRITEDEAETSVSFQEKEMDMYGLCAGDEDRLLAVEVWMSRANGSHVFAGSTEGFSVRGLKIGSKGGFYDINGPTAEGLKDGIIAFGSAHICGQFVPEANEDDGFGKKGSAGSASLGSHARNSIEIRFVKLKWTEPKRRGLLSGPGGGLLAGLKIRSARV